MQPVDVVVLPSEPDSSRSVAIGETERIYGTKWTVVVTLRPDRSFLEERIRIYNPTFHVRPYYFWNCTAAPNTPGFRFIYPMTLGCDHGAEKFFNWPLDHGKDLTRGTNYQDASSIFAWYCDQDFFGSYDDGAQRGVVAYANHHQVPGKKAWTWGQGGFGKMHQRDLTDTDGPYNEVQTGPLLTQGEVGRLEPCEAVEWREWWYPVHDLGGFTYANRDVAVNAELQNGQLRLRILGTADWGATEARLHDRAGAAVQRLDCYVSPSKAADVTFRMPDGMLEPEVELLADGKSLARFKVPLPLPQRTRPEPKPKPETAAEFAQSGWDHLLFARVFEAHAQFRLALEKDPKSVPAHTGLAMLSLESEPAVARREAEAALAIDPDCGLARLALAKSWLGENDTVALDHAWRAALNPATASAGRALAGRILIAQHRYRDALEALSGPGPWTGDLLCAGERAFAEWMRGDKDAAVRGARAVLEQDPLDAFALSVLALAGAKPEADRLLEVAAARTPIILELVTRYFELKHEEIALQFLQSCYLGRVSSTQREALLSYWADFLRSRLNMTRPAGQAARDPGQASLWPSDTVSAQVLQDCISRNPSDGQAVLLLGHALFHLGRDTEARTAWQRAADLGASRAIADRALGMAALTLDKDTTAAGNFLAQAHRADSTDPIVARDLARILSAQADKADTETRRRELWTDAREALMGAFATGKSRSDFVCLLGRVQNQLGDYMATARLLDSVRITVWEGSHEAHDLFEEAHLALGRAHMEAGRAADALKEFDRALEYPENLAIGRLENAREDHIQRLRAEALTKLGREAEAEEAREIDRKVQRFKNRQ